MAPTGSRILIASKRAPGTPGRRDGGVQTWIATVAAELRRLGHTVHVADRTMPAVGSYDVGIFANAPHTARMASACRRVLLVSHGIVPDESPVGWLGPVAFTSEEVRAHWGLQGPVIRQPVDLGFWSPARRPKRRNLIRYANRGGLEWLPHVAHGLSLPFVHVRNATPVQARDMLREAACVLASGRCAVEAMACGAPVVICDDRHYQGPLLASALVGMARNYSGRGGEVPTVENVTAAVVLAKSLGSDWRGHAELHHDVQRIVPQLLAEAGACSTC